MLLMNVVNVLDQVYFQETAIVMVTSTDVMVSAEVVLYLMNVMFVLVLVSLKENAIVSEIP